MLKPTVGVVDMVTKAAEGAKNTVTYFDDKKRKRLRPPRYFGPQKLLEEYSETKAEGQYLLKTISQGQFEVPKDGILFVTSFLGRRVLLPCFH